MHVYRDCDRRPDADKLASSPSTREVDLDDGVTLGVLAVPSWMTPSDFLAFVAPAAEGMAHLRLVRSVVLPVSRFWLIVTSQNILCRDSMPNRSMALIRFRRSEEAKEFVEAYNGKPFNSMDVSNFAIACVGNRLNPVPSLRHAMSYAFYPWKLMRTILYPQQYLVWALHSP